MKSRAQQKQRLYIGETETKVKRNRDGKHPRR